MILVVDHRDSFTWNLVHQLQKHAPVRVLQHDEVQIQNALEAELLVLSPGPGQPADYPHTREIYEACRGKVSIMGICLGFQLILEAEGGQVIRQPRVLHGVSTPMEIVNNPIFEGCAMPMNVARYHSLMVDPSRIPDNFMLIGTDKKTAAPLAIQHKKYNIVAFQFHPDSFLTEYGDTIVANVYRQL